MNEIIIEKIRKSEIDDVSYILTNAFKTNPAYSIIFKSQELEKGLKWLFKANLTILNHREPLTRVIKEKNTNHIIGTYTIVPPDGVKNSLSIYSKIEIPSFISKFGINPLIRMVSLDNYNKKILNESIKSLPYYYLHMVVVKEEYRGTGIGSYAIKNAIDELRFYNPPCNSLALTTQLPENVTFYSRLGFENIGEGYIVFKGNKYYNWNMRLKLF